MCDSIPCLSISTLLSIHQKALGGFLSVSFCPQLPSIHLVNNKEKSCRFLCGVCCQDCTILGIAAIISIASKVCGSVTGTMTTRYWIQSCRFQRLVASQVQRDHPALLLTPTSREEMDIPFQAYLGKRKLNHLRECGCSVTIINRIDVPYLNWLPPSPL